MAKAAIRRWGFAVAALLCLVALLGCQRSYTPRPEVEAFLNTGLDAQKAFEALSGASYTTSITHANKAGEVLGSAEHLVGFDKSDPENLYLRMEQRFTGTQVADGVTENLVQLQRDEAGRYQYTSTVNGLTERREVDEAFAYDLVASLVYTDNGAYDEGGLYYGDLFMLNIYRYPPESFSVESAAGACVFDEKMHIVKEDIGDVYLYQTTRVNALGLLLYDYERYEGGE